MREKFMMFNKQIQSIKPYKAGKSFEFVTSKYKLNPKDVIKLASNENPNGCSLKVIDLLKKELGNLNIYPDDGGHNLKNALCKKFSVNLENIILGNGSSQLIDMAVRIKLNPKNRALASKVTFSMYEIYTKLLGSTILRTSCDTYNLDEMLEIYKNSNNVDLIFLSVPNNPLGDCLSSKEIIDFLKCIDSNTLLVIDGAYQEYASFKDPKKHIEPSYFIDKFPNVLYLGTFSKVYGLASLRVGFAIASKSIINALSQVKPPFNISSIAMQAAKNALVDQEFVEKSISMNFEQMNILESFFRRLNIKTLESYGNFITLILSEAINSLDMVHKLSKEGIIVRDLSSYFINGVRITVGTQEQNSILMSKVKKIYKSLVF